MSTAIQTAQHQVFRSIIWERIFVALASRPDNVACKLLGDDGLVNGQLTASQLLDEVKRLSVLIQRVLSGRVTTAALSRNGSDEQAVCDAVAAPPLIAIHASAGVQYVVAVLTVLRCGAAYLPLDPGWPPQRLHALLRRCSPALLLHVDAQLPQHLVSAAAAQSLPLLPLQLPTILAAIPKADCVGDMHGGGSSDGAAATVHELEKKLLPLPWCYVLYTSGSTGQPLGVCGTECGVLNRCAWMAAEYPFCFGDCVPLKTPPAFVDSVWELFGPLLAGVPLALLPPAMLAQPLALVNALVAAGASHVVAVPTLLAVLVPQLREAKAKLQLRFVISSGEPLPRRLALELVAALPSACALLNLYGSTEVAADVTVADVRMWLGEGACGVQAPGLSSKEHKTCSCEGHGCREAAPAGWPIARTAVFIAALHQDGAGDSCKVGGGSTGDAGVTGGGGNAGSGGGRKLQVAAVGEVGEVCVAGEGVAAGYFQDAEATAARFVHVDAETLALPPAAASGDGMAAGVDRAVLLGAGFGTEGAAGMRVCVFRSGDQGWVEEGGPLRLAGRCDLQIKVAGARVDLAEVERVLAAHPSVAAAAATLRKHAGRERLIAFLELIALPSAHPCSLPPAQPVAAADSETSPTPAQPALSAALHVHCAASLSPPAVPDMFVVLPRLPRSTAGKLQRGALPESLPDSVQAAPISGALPGTPSEHGSWECRCMVAFASALPAGVRLEPTTNFFAAGGTSLDAVAAAAYLHLDVRQLLAHPTARKLAAFCVGEAAGYAPLAEQMARPPSPAAKRRRLAMPKLPAQCASDINNAHVRQGRVEVGAPLLVAMHAGRWQLCGDEAQPGAACQLPRPPPEEFTKHPAKQCGQPPPVLLCRWRVPLAACVDAPPLVVLGLQPQARAVSHATLPAWEPSSGSWRVYACCHGGDVCCVDGATGKTLWRTCLPARCDAGMALSRCGRVLAVACGDGRLHMLDAGSGSSQGSCEVGGEMRSAPVADPWHPGRFWATSHAQALTVCDATCRIVARAPLRAATAAGLVLCAAARVAVCATLEGEVVAFSISHDDVPGPLPPGGLNGASGAIALTSLWVRRLDGPIFSTPVIHDPCRDPGADSNNAIVVVSSVHGMLCAFSVADGNLCWRVELGRRIFAPLALLPWHGDYGEAVVVVGQAGMLHALNAANGASLFQCDVGVPLSTSISPCWEGWPACLAGSRAPRHAVVCGDNGGVFVLELPRSVAGEAGEAADGRDHCAAEPDSALVARVVESVQLPSEVFSAPVAVAGVIVVGCRDDALYCLDLNSE